MCVPAVVDMCFLRSGATELALTVHRVQMCIELQLWVVTGGAPRKCAVLAQVPDKLKPGARSKQLAPGSPSHPFELASSLLLRTPQFATLVCSASEACLGVQQTSVIALHSTVHSMVWLWTAEMLNDGSDVVRLKVHDSWPVPLEPVTALAMTSVGGVGGHGVPGCGLLLLAGTEGAVRCWAATGNSPSAGPLALQAGYSDDWTNPVD